MLLCEKQIQGYDFEVHICTLENLELCKMVIEGDECPIQDVDLAQAIRATVKSNTVEEFETNIKGMWAEERIKTILEGGIPY